MQLIEKIKQLFRPGPEQALDDSQLVKRFEEFQEHIGYQFREISLLVTALKHRSFQANRTPSEEAVATNERLEFLGDSVLNLVVSEEMYHRYPNKREGELTRFKSLVVNGAFLVKKANAIGLGRMIFMSNAEEKMGGRRRASILEDAYEALIGAIYIDGGMPPAAAFIRAQILENLDVKRLDVSNLNHKSVLLEFAQGRGYAIPTYRVIQEEGPDHRKQFLVEVLIGEEALAQGSGSSKKKAEQVAAKQAMKKLNDAGKDLLGRLQQR